MGEGTQALADIAELEQLAEQLSQSYPGASMDDVDLDALARQLGDQAAVGARTLAELERALGDVVLRHAVSGLRQFAACVSEPQGNSE
ncbi:integral membrane protein [Mycobacterium tuberculosis M995]|nr:integral membrane protein [Mycobacterium tuberculosis M995]